MYQGPDQSRASAREEEQLVRGKEAAQDGIRAVSAWPQRSGAGSKTHDPTETNSYEWGPVWGKGGYSAPHCSIDHEPE